MDDIKDKIAKLLSLAGSPNENEAKEALLKARALMARHKLRPEEIEKNESRRVIKQLLEINCTKMTNAWAVTLSQVIASNYCCQAYRQHKKGEKKVTIGLVGLEDDFWICEKVFKYAFDCVESQCKEIKANNKGYPAAYIRQITNAYGVGFCIGLSEAYKEQQKQHQEWGLVLVIPKEVTAATSHMEEGKRYASIDVAGLKTQFARKGYADGLKFDPSTKLEQPYAAELQT